jgi:hypothetical protein
VQECLPFRRAIGKWSDDGGGTESWDDKDDDGGVGVDGRGQC